ncbi:MAG TPA: zinc ribbon domain-containing protein [Acidimicrobiia bacterium]|nr:zinc ribbon domain-containing protein [Acidimicrobiia bacterium]
MEPIVYHQRIKLPYRYTAGDAVTAFIDGLAEGTILGAPCGRCEATVVPARPFCPTCSGSLTEFVPVGTGGEITTFTVDGDGRVMAMIRLDGADTAFPFVVDADPSDVSIGTRVEARFAADPPRTVEAIEAFVIA